MCLLPHQQGRSALSQFVRQSVSMIRWIFTEFLERVDLDNEQLIRSDDLFGLFVLIENELLFR